MRITAAHMTALRFSQPLADGMRLADALAALRRCEFGTTHVAEIQLVEHDWYMSHDSMRILARYPLQ